MTGPTTVRLAGGAQGFNWLPVFVAEEQGIFARNGLEIDYQRLGSVDKATTAVREGTADLAITPPEGAVADHLAGGGLRIIGSNSERLPMSLVARPGIPDLAALRGRRIGTSSLTEGTAIYAQQLLRQAGLGYPDDYEFVLAGVHTARWKALQDGEIDAAPQPAPWNFLAEREGYGLLGEIPDVLPEIIFAAVIGNAPWLQENQDAVTRLITSLAEGHAFVNDPANDAVTSPIYQRITTPDEPELAARGLDYTRRLGMWPEGLRVSPRAFDSTVEVMVQAGLLPQDRRDAAAGVLDTRFSRSADH
ncbi:ABC transporter substrate-binding protein [Modestobacter roseus]|uniref:NitT/TauT family transport system substrate-binding protein n=1 Tax=Modestobacter roseus TaxID=1181884 RepID=A0A562IP13_9ACTN|nr:ABC transporter substrate-binding protein [Modestobacter roseus]MQA34394.1 PhnD/SsuA/transferrin family substrate-binding protein [Modestobacter roseus]TWH72721.1 NitT/TauT family transport system substrate-binding protein [Modestobacter roseus]